MTQRKGYFALSIAKTVKQVWRFGKRIDLALGKKEKMRWGDKGNLIKVQKNRNNGGLSKLFNIKNEGKKSNSMCSINKIPLKNVICQKLSTWEDCTLIFPPVEEKAGCHNLRGIL